MLHHEVVRRVVAGVDGSDDGLRAAAFAADEASRTGLPLTLLHAYHVSAALNPMLPLYGVESLRETGQRHLDEAERALRERHPDVRLEKLLIATSASQALVDASKEASRVVVGRRSLHGLKRLFSGSTSTALAARAKCPVIAVPHDWHPGQKPSRVVVGCDGSEAGRNALAFAFAAASQRGEPLLAVRVWEVPVRWYSENPLVGDEAVEWLEQAQLTLAEDLAGWSEAFPEVRLERAFIRSASPAEALVRRADGSSLLVLGARGLGGVPGLDLGWTARTVLSQATCPVAVVGHQYAHPVDAAHAAVNVPAST